MRRRRAAAAAGVIALAAGGAAIALGGGGSEPEARASTGATVAVEQRDLVAETVLDGTLGYADARSTSSRLGGTLTWVAPEGDTVRPGEALFRVDDERVLLLDGERPAWRTLSSAVSDGPDVEQLERNLHALGFDDGYELTVDDDWTAATTAAVKELQEAAGLPETGSLELGRVVFLDGPRRIGSHEVAVGDAVGPGGPVVKTTALRRQVDAILPADEQGAARVGGRADVSLPDGSTVTGRIASIGAVAQTDEESGASTIDLTVTLPSKHIPPLDQAPVSVSVASRRRRDAVVVPVVALLAQPGGGYGVQLSDGSTVKVTPGLFADGYVEVEGVRPGQRVAVPE
jgi:peptidoglycan hydrolase-like protein with peptidoglycan-binding domain